tara:strand:+ start:1648 stop:2268 length:621 start_codon:yes stop_codon:yes gene_type:complete
MISKVTIILLVLGVITCAESAYLTAEAKRSPRDLVDTLHNTLIVVMKNAQKLGFKGRYTKLAPILSETFDLSLMTRVSSGGYWHRASEKEKLALVDAFSKISISTYASRFTAFSGQKFKTIRVKDGPQATRLVETKLINPSGDNLELIYVVKRIDDKWRIIDVILDLGISELAVRRSEYRRILKSGGVRKLISMLNEKANQLTFGE